MENNISFRGTFLLKKPAPQTTEAIRKALGKGTLIYEKIGDKASDVLIVTRNVNDAIAAEYIGKNELAFNYYPFLDTESGFIPNQAQHAINLIERSKAKFLDTAKGMMRAIRKTKPISSVINEADKYPYLATTVKRFNLDSSGNFVVKTKGMHKIINKDEKVIARISGPNGAKRHYVELVESNSDMPTLKFEMDANGEITDRFKSLRTPEFMKKFNAATKYNKQKI